MLLYLKVFQLGEDTQLDQESLWRVLEYVVEDEKRHEEILNLIKKIVRGKRATDHNANR